MLLGLVCTICYTFEHEPGLRINILMPAGAQWASLEKYDFQQSCAYYNIDAELLS